MNILTYCKWLEEAVSLAEAQFYIGLLIYFDSPKPVSTVWLKAQLAHYIVYPTEKLNWKCVYSSVCVLEGQGQRWTQDVWGTGAERNKKGTIAPLCTAHECTSGEGGCHHFIHPLFVEPSAERP